MCDELGDEDNMRAYVELASGATACSAADGEGCSEKEAEYAAAMARTAELVPELNAALAELEGMIYSEDFCTEGGLSLDDIDLWSRLRSVTLVKGAQFGPKTTAYLKNLEAKGDVPLYFSLAC